MNIVYKFDSKVTGKYYIGSKTECVVVDGKIVDRRGKYYFTSSKDENLRKEFFDGNMVLSVLEKDIKKSKVIEREAFWQRKYNAIDDVNCYNKVYADIITPTLNIDNWDLVINIYGETLKEYTVNSSTMARLDKAAIREGFVDAGDKMFRLLEEKEILGTYRSLDEKYNKRGYHKRFLKGASLVDFDKDIDIFKIIDLLRHGTSFILACKLCNYNMYVVRRAFGDSYNDILTIHNYTANINGFLRREDFSKEILKKFLSGMTRNAIADSYKELSISSVSRYLDAEIRSRLDINEI